MAFCTVCGASIAGSFCTQCGTRINAGGTAPPPGQTGARMTPPPAASYGGASQAAPVARKTSPLVWILVAIMGFFMLCGIAIFGAGLFFVHKAKQAGIDPDLWRRNPGMAAGKLVTAMNPELETVRTDDNAGTITLRNRRTGKEMTITFDQARQGRISFKAEDDNGKTATVEIGGAGKPPIWVPEYPGSHPAYSVKGASDSGEEGGNFTFTTDDPPSKVMSFYQDKVRDMGMEARLTTTSADASTLVAAREGDERSLTVVVVGSGTTTVNVTYARKR